MPNKRAFIVDRGVMVRLYVDDECVQEYHIGQDEVANERRILSSKGFDITTDRTY
jgi:hypothetical protein